MKSEEENGWAVSYSAHTNCLLDPGPKQNRPVYFGDWNHSWLWSVCFSSD